MKMSLSEAARLSRQARKKMEETINAYADNFRPEILEQRMENGYTYTLYAPGCADGGEYKPICKPTGRSKQYEL